MHEASSQKEEGHALKNKISENGKIKSHTDPKNFLKHTSFRNMLILHSTFSYISYVAEQFSHEIKDLFLKSLNNKLKMPLTIF